MTLITPLRKQTRGKELAWDHTTRKKWQNWDQTQTCWFPETKFIPPGQDNREASMPLRVLSSLVLLNDPR